MAPPASAPRSKRPRPSPPVVLAAADERSPASPLADHVYLAPMVRGSELAARMFGRSLYGPDFLCYGPMLRCNEVVRAHGEVWRGRFRSDPRKVLALTPEDKIELREQMREDAYLTVLDTCPADSPLVVQLCGRDPSQLAEAVSALMEIYDALGNPLLGIDLNLGCPQMCASEGGFGAFLAEDEPELAAECVRAMREAVDSRDCSPAPSSEDRSASSTDAVNEGNGGGTLERKPRLSAKIRLQDSVTDTIAFAHKLRDAGCELLAVHCRRREDKHDGRPDYDAGASIVRALRGKQDKDTEDSDAGFATDMPVVINGDIRSAEDARRVLEWTGADAVMAARGFLENPRMLLPRNSADPSVPRTDPVPRVGPASQQSSDKDDDKIKAHDDFECNDDSMSQSPAFLAAEYLTFAERYPPPSALYVRKHLRWIFRGELQPSRPLDSSDSGSGPSSKGKGKGKWPIDYSDWRPRLWTFLVRPYLETAEQFRGVVGLYVMLSGGGSTTTTNTPPSLEGMEEPSFKSIRRGRKKKEKKTATLAR